MDPNKLASILTNDDVDHILIHYFSSAAHLAKLNKDGSLAKTKHGANGVMNKILDNIDNQPMFKEMLLDEIKYRNETS